MEAVMNVQRFLALNKRLRQIRFYDRSNLTLLRRARLLRLERALGFRLGAMLVPMN
jgi:hypothetical protein